VVAPAGLSAADLRAAADDEALEALLLAELARRLPERLRADDACVAQLCRLPPGLRAVAATHPLDVSVHLDDLGWHFAN